MKFLYFIKNNEGKIIDYSWNEDDARAFLNYYREICGLDGLLLEKMEVEYILKSPKSGAAIVRIKGEYLLLYPDVNVTEVEIKDKDSGEIYHFTVAQKLENKKISIHSSFESAKKELLKYEQMLFKSEEKFKDNKVFKGF